MTAQAAFRLDPDDPIDNINRMVRRLCPFCGEDPDVKGFRNKKRRREFDISGLCQTCQDDVFGK